MSDLDTLASELRVSQSTVRRDVEALEQAGLVRRTHGGVIWVGEKLNGGTRPYAFDQRMGYQLEAKRQIARAARGLVQAGDTVLIGGGARALQQARARLGGLDEMDVVVGDAGLSAEHRAAVKAAGCELIVAG